MTHSLSKKATAPAVLSRAQLIEIYGATLFDDIDRAIMSHGPGRSGRDCHRSIQRMLSHYSFKPEPPSAAFRDVLKQTNQKTIDAQEAIRLTTSMLEGWMDFEKSTQVLSGPTVADYGRNIARLLEWLGRLEDRNYPKFLQSFVPIRDGSSKGTRTLGELNWPECDGLRGAAAERKGLELVRTDALAEFAILERVFQFGQAIISSQTPPRDIDSIAWHQVKELLMAEHNNWSTTGRSIFQPNSEVKPSILPLSKALLSEGTWFRAGLSFDNNFSNFANGTSQNHGKFRVIANLVASCLGPTPKATLAISTIFACDAGWNPQPILALPRNPFLFRTGSDCSIADNAFVSSFKKRAGHHVLAYTEAAAPLSGIPEEHARAHWYSTIDEMDPTTNSDGYILLPNTAPLLDVMKRYTKMTDAARNFDITGQFTKKFFFNISFLSGIFLPSRPERFQGTALNILGRPGVHFKSIRKTFLCMKLREVGSISANRHLASHAGQNVLMPHYNNTKDISSELDENIRFFQNAIQALIIGDRPRAKIRIVFGSSELEWFSRLARISGISALLNIPVETGAQECPLTLEFKPSNESLRDLFIYLRAFRVARNRMDQRRWRIQAMPLFAALIAVRKEVQKKGLLPAYLNAARSAFLDLSNGLKVSPPILDL